MGSFVARVPIRSGVIFPRFAGGFLTLSVLDDT